MLQKFKVFIQQKKMFRTLNDASFNRIRNRFQNKEILERNFYLQIIIRKQESPTHLFRSKIFDFNSLNKLIFIIWLVLLSKQSTNVLLFHIFKFLSAYYGSILQLFMKYCCLCAQQKFKKKIFLHTVSVNYLDMRNHE